MTPDIKILCLGQSNMQGSGGNTGYTPAKVNVLVHDGSEWVHCEDPYDPQGLTADTELLWVTEEYIDNATVDALYDISPHFNLVGNSVGDNLILFTQNKLPASFSFRSGFGY